MDNYELDGNLTFCDAFGYALRAYRSQSPLTVHALNLALIQQEGVIALLGNGALELLLWQLEIETAKK